MSRQAWAILIVALALMLGAAGFISQRKAHQKLGTPGVRVSAQPVYDPEGNIVGTNSVELPVQVLDFRSEPQPVARLVLDWLPKDTTYGQRLYQAPDGLKIAVTVVLMGADRTSIHKPEYCLQGSGWSIEKNEPTRLAIPQPYPYELPARKLTLSRQNALSGGGTEARRGYFVYWFVADRQLTGDHNQRMWWMARDLIRTGVLQRWAYVICFAVGPTGQDEATLNRLNQFITAAVPQFQLAAGTPSRLAGGPRP